MTEPFPMAPLREAKASGNRYLLGVDGLSRSGKTTWAENLSCLLNEEGLKAVTFHLDDHITTRRERYHTSYSQWEEYYRLQWNVQRLAKVLFQPLREASTICLPYYDQDSDAHQWQTRSLEEADVVIVEGVFLQRDEWRGSFDQVVFLDCPRSVRFSRETDITQQKRDKFEQRYWKAEDYYCRTCQPKLEADLVIKGSHGC
ncbi:hypothetical protein H0266_02300 [Halobacillus locisalis]|uniref:Phosphoribulokinase/uridine kinase domain-containing protein n=1 Tax=Halobacillus locisalis TaxID=220753 RepID=A0A838CP57_9BACI|nr:kinase [Halobacillus locisalis]MBA2173721.1 hypothetical protein [Halobacillus locisalis]